MINRLVSQRYEVVEKIGESRLFTLYKARDKAMSRIVALKAVSPAYAEDLPFMQGLQVGLTASARLNHPHIAAFYEFSAEEGTPYGIFEFVRGINLKERIRRIAPFTLSVAVDIGIAVGEALHYAHNLGQVHGDIRPQNIIVSPEGAVKVTDFGVMAGVARSAEAQGETLLRAASYHAPELSTTQVGTPTGDIYALGAVLYEMLTGTPVYAGDSLEATADLHAFAPIPSPRVINSGVPRSIEGIIIKCLQKRPDGRYASAADLLTDLKAVRDALRFGKPLSWSPIELDRPAPKSGERLADRSADRSAERSTAGAAAPLAATTVAAAAVSRSISTAPPRPLEPVATATASSVATMPANKNRLRARDERVSIVLKVLLGLMTGAILLLLIGFVVVYSSSWIVPPPVTVPDMIGKPVEEVQAMADRLKIRLILHGSYSDRARNIVYKTDQPRGVQLQAKHAVNVWYSKGPEYVNVPDVVGIEKEQAEQKLKDAGLTVGKVMPEYSKKVPRNAVISQNVSYKKRVLHDTAVDLMFSDGPQPDFSDGQTTDNPDGNTPDSSSSSGQDDTAANSGANPGPAQNGSDPNAAPVDDTQHEFNRTITIPKDHKGSRQVRIEMIDQHVENDHLDPVVLIDEVHDEGDKIPLSFQYHGKYITLRIYYDNGPTPIWSRRFDPSDAKNKGRIN